MTAIASKALWLEPDGHLSIKNLSEKYRPENGEALVEIPYSGINPADTKHALLGIHSTVSGYDFCGTVKEVSPGCAYRIGDVIAGYTPTGVGRPVYYGTHQSDIIYPANELAFKVPPNMPIPDAACFMVTVRTAADVLFNLMEYPLPGEGTAPTGALLIWGGSTSLGLAVIQFARAIGISTIVTTASEQNHALLRRLGATECFDYRKDDVVERIRAWAVSNSQDFTRILDAVGSMEMRTADTAASCGGTSSKVVSATVHPKYRAPFAISENDIHLKIAHVGDVVVAARRDDAKRSQAALLWAVKHYGTGFVMPKVTVLDCNMNEAIKIIKDIGDGKAGLGKFVLKHPLQ